MYVNPEIMEAIKYNAIIFSKIMREVIILAGIFQIGGVHHFNF